MSRKPEPEFDLSGGVLCLDFANTVSERGSPNRSWDYTQGYDDLIVFPPDEGVLTPRDAREVVVFSRTKPKRGRGCVGLHYAAGGDLPGFRRLGQVSGAAPKDVKMIEGFTRQAIKMGDRNCIEDQRRSFIGYPGAAQFRRKF